MVYNHKLGSTSMPFGNVQSGTKYKLSYKLLIRVIRKVTLSSPYLWASLHPPLHPLSGRTLRRGGRQQPHQTLKKSKKYKGGKKCHTMVAQSSPKMPKQHHSALKA
jgi:hypothetical protein